MRASRGTVALVVALAAPLLLASTGLSVDVGYWYQQQESLQSAADSAAVAAALSDGVLGQTSSTGKQSSAQPLATAAGDNATNSQFGFAAGQNGSAMSVAANILSTSSSGQSTVTTTQFTATARIPRGTFFSSVSGIGIAGMIPGKQYASATTQTTSVYSPVCLLTTATNLPATMYTGNGGSSTGQTGFVGVNCGFFNNSSACGGGANDAIVDSNTPMVIQATTIRTAGCGYSAFANGISPGIGGLVQKQTTMPDPYGSMDTGCTSSAAASACITWPATPALPNTAIAASLPAVGATGPASTSTLTCTTSGNGNSYTAPWLTKCASTSSGQIMIICVVTGYASGQETCNFAPNYISSSAATSYYVNATTGALFGSGSGANNNFNCVSLGVTGSASKGYTLTCGAPSSAGAATTDFYYGLYGNLNGTLTISGGTIEASATTCPSGGAKQCALEFYGPTQASSPALSFGPGTYYFYGGVYLDLSGKVPSTVSEDFGVGTYYITALTGNTNIDDPVAGGALNIASNDIVNFEGGTYFFNGGLTVGGNATAYFGPGIYYIENGDLLFNKGAKISADGATFVLEASPISSKYNAAYVMSGNTAFTMIAPGMKLDSYSSQPCVQPAAFVAGATNGEGICGVLFYQTRNNPAADTVGEGAGGSGKNNTIDGEIYAPAAPLTMTGTGSLTAGNSQNFGMVQYSVSSGTTGGLLQLQQPTDGSAPIVGSTTAQPYLVN